MMENKILVAKNVTKIYGVGTKNPYTALSDVSLEMYEGEFVCVMGPSGAGKSTFINNLSTIDIPTKVLFILMVKRYDKCRREKLVNSDMKI